MTAALDGDGNKYFACPERFIPDSITEFIEIYDYEKEFKAAAPYETRASKFIDAVRVYNSEIRRLQDGAERNPDSLRKMKQWLKKPT